MKRKHKTKKIGRENMMMRNKRKLKQKEGRTKRMK